LGEAGPNEYGELNDAHGLGYGKAGGRGWGGIQRKTSGDAVGEKEAERRRQG